MARPKKTNSEILNNYVAATNGCHAYIGNNGPIYHRRPNMRIEGKLTSVARTIYTLIYGAIPSGLLIRHKCDNEWCVNPLHLEIGDHAQNSRDMVERARQASGSKNGWSKINESIAAAIREEWIPRINSMPKLAKKYGVCIDTIARVLHSQGWVHVRGKRYEMRGLQCSRGHELTSDNAFLRRDGRKECKQCRTERNERNKYKIKTLHRMAHLRKQIKNVDPSSIWYCECGLGFKSQRSRTLHKSWGKCQKLIEQEERSS